MGTPHLRALEFSPLPMFQLLLTRHVAVAGRRAYSTSGIPPLPPFEDWKKTIKHATVQLRDRVSVGNAETAAKLANAFIPEGLKDQVIIESFPGMLVCCWPGLTC
jgi:hypothetical protein